MKSAKVAHLDVLSTRELIALVFLLDQDKQLEDLQRSVGNYEFLRMWRASRVRYEKLIEHYPNADEERFFLVATLEAVHGFDPCSEKTLELRESHGPLAKILAALD